MVDLVEVMGGMGEYDVMYTGREWKYFLWFVHVGLHIALIGRKELALGLL